MAQEITATGTLSVTKNSVTTSAGKVGLSITMTGDDVIKQTQLVGITEELLVLGTDIGTNGWLFVRNLDPTNFVCLRAATAAANLAKMLPGEFCLLRLMTGITPYVVSDTAACRIEYLHIEN